MPATQPEEREYDAYVAERNREIIATAIALAKAKNDRLRLMKERNEICLAERAQEGSEDEL